MNVTFPLSKDELSSLYFQLQKNGAFCRGEDKNIFNDLELERVLSIAVEASRWDIRLLYILVHYITHYFKNIRPFKLRDHLLKNPSPNIIGVIREFIISKNTTVDLNDFLSILVKPLKTPSYYSLFNLSRPFHIETVNESARFSLREYKRWGYLGKELPFLKETDKKDSIHYSKSERVNILMRLFELKNPITIKDYLDALSYSITRQHARLDLLSIKNIRKKGSTKGSVYSLER